MLRNSLKRGGLILWGVKTISCLEMLKLYIEIERSYEKDAPDRKSL